MAKYGIVEFTDKVYNLKHLYRVEPLGNEFKWGDGTSIEDCKILYLVSSTNTTELDLSFKLDEIVKFYIKQIYDFEDDESAKLWFRLNY
jgi:hypothetical protein